MFLTRRTARPSAVPVSISAQPLLLLFADPQHLVAGRAQRGHAGLGVGERHLQDGPFGGQRGAQLVRGVGHEMPLRLE
ncbi:MAG: hypothetical protein ABSB76_23755 [Streptosporangiaceae bacterium]